MQNYQSNQKYLAPAAGAGVTIILAAVIYITMLNGNQVTNQIPTFYSTDFRFDIYCPINSP